MEIDEKEIREFQKLYAEEFGEEISTDEARVMAGRLLALYLALAKKLPDEKDHTT